ncbi:hypothetical protein Glove_701g14 [Diversispora epigaea]|uniref:Protein PNS1 n=1 Tax=Diversispora epigaea TaxID=1348612 RepID=A0A397G1Z3_9GLOM|nr:hypothetical protein Glove_701g14 [Diversispora epigaea]
MSQPYYPPPSGAYSPVIGTENSNYQPPTYEYSQGSVHSKIGEKWNPKPKYQDLWAAILFLIHFAGFVVLSYIGIKELVTNNEINNSNTNINLDSKTILLLVASGVLGFFLSLIYMIFAQRFPKPLIKITLYLSILTYFIVAVVYAYYKQYVLAILFGIFGILYLICAFTWRDRIPFAAIMLETVISIAKRYYGTIVMGFVGLILQVGWSVWWAVSIIGAYQYFYAKAECQTTTQNGQSTTTCNNITPVYIVLVFMVFSFYWTSQVIKTLVHVTDSGVYATYYFLEGTIQGVGSTPTISSLKRACTTSFGSICFGSLIIALINTVRVILRTLAENEEGVLGFIAACFACLLACIEPLVEYFNRYAYVEVAIYGKSYCRAAKDTWTLIKDRGVEAIINDNLIGNVLVMGAFFIGVLCALFGFGYIKIAKPDFIDNNNIILLFVIICFLLGFMMTVVVTDAIDSGVATTFVALAEDPEALRRTKPELFERIRQRWPRVVQGI